MDYKELEKIITQYLKDIEKTKGDYDIAHGLEDTLYREFIEYVALEDNELGRLAKLVLTSKNIGFARYTA